VVLPNQTKLHTQDAKTPYVSALLLLRILTLRWILQIALAMAIMATSVL
jgi:hypothetical protein